MTMPRQIIYIYIQERLKIFNKLGFMKNVFKFKINIYKFISNDSNTYYFVIYYD